LMLSGHQYRTFDWSEEFAYGEVGDEIGRCVAATDSLSPIL
jgi:hypothetical protein